MVFGLEFLVGALVGGAAVGVVFIIWGIHNSNKIANARAAIMGVVDKVDSTVKPALTAALGHLGIKV